MRKNLPYLLLVFVIAIIFISCVSQRKVSSAKNKLTVLDSQFLKYDNTLAELNTQRKNKQEQNEIDDTASTRIQKFVDSTNADINNLLTNNSVLIGTAIVNKTDWEKLVKSLSLSRKSSKQIGDKIGFLTDLVNQNLVIKIDQDIIFEPGQYIVTQAMVDVISKYFEPPAKEIDLFIKKYPDFPLSLVITAKGYADGTSIAEGTSLYKNLMARLKLNTTAPDNKELNKELSRARAEEVIRLFKKFAAARSGNGSYLKNVLYLHEGKGEILPYPKITDYKIDDSRRRVVLLYWSVFPE